MSRRIIKDADWRIKHQITDNGTYVYLLGYDNRGRFDGPEIISPNGEETYRHKDEMGHTENIIDIDSFGNVTSEWPFELKYRTFCAAVNKRARK